MLLFGENHCKNELIEENNPYAAASTNDGKHW